MDGKSRLQGDKEIFEERFRAPRAMRRSGSRQ